jgi:Domain of unknown function (DUF4136)
MRLRKFAAAALIGAAALGLSACASSITSTVSRYQAMPAPQGQTFFVVPAGGEAANGGLEFQRYAGLVAQQLQARGYTPAASAQTASMLVQLGYEVDDGQVRVVEDPFYRSRYYDPFYRGRYGFYDPFYSPFSRSRFYYPRFGYYRSPFSYGWDDPYWYGGGADSYVEYHSEVDLHIRQNGTNAPLFDGRAQARSQTNRLDVVIPSLVEAMFTNFPGRNGETVKITIPTRPRS